MFRFFLFLRPDILKRLAGFTAVAAVVVTVSFFATLAAPPAWAFGLSAICLGAMFYPHARLVSRFCRATWRFRTANAGPVVLKYAPELNGRIDLDHCLKHASQALAHFSQKFGITLRRPLVIFLFPTSTTMSRIFKAPYGGFALISGDAIGVSAEPVVSGTVDEIILHEMAHLFSARVGGLDPPLKSEGLATWLMGTVDGKPIDFHALAALLTGRYEFLIRLAAKSYFYRAANSYVLAGSFTGDLIARFGWDRYRDFFHRATKKKALRVL